MNIKKSKTPSPLVALAGLIPFVTALLIWVVAAQASLLLQIILTVLHFTLFGIAGFVIYNKEKCIIKTTAFAMVLPLLGAIIELTAFKFMPDIISYSADILGYPLRQMFPMANRILVVVCNVFLLAAVFYLGCMIKDKRKKA